MLFDKQAKCDIWQELEANEINDLTEYKVFCDLGKGLIPPKDYKKIRYHMMYDLKHDG
jgi:hypothetical protein